MHLNYFFLHPLCDELHQQLLGSTLVECFSQQKDELILHFHSTKGQSFFIRASLIPRLTFVTFPETFARTKKNSVDLFGEAIGGQVKKVEAVTHDRSFLLRLDQGFTFLFKMHGSRSNIIGLDSDGGTQLFRTQLGDDLRLTPEELHNPLALTKERFEAVDGDLKAFAPTLGKEAVAYLDESGYQQLEVEKQWQLLARFLDQLNHPSFHICRAGGKIKLLLFETGEVLMTTSSALEAARVYAQKISREFYLETELQPVLTRLRRELKQTENYLAQATEKYLEISESSSYAQMADVLMANLHQVPPGAEKVVLDNFYTGQPIEIRLRKELSPQKNAEVFYRKSKNQRIEVGKLEEVTEAKEDLKLQLAGHLAQLESMQKIKQIRQYLTAHGLVNEKKQRQETRPFKEFFIGGYQVWVGTNAKNNDELTLKYATKNDLWLHAKDVAGSHVVVKWKAGQNYPKPVIEQAASLAAHFSKRKTDNLCPVIVTPKKYVRKPKGADPGAVIVEREEVVMVEPGLPAAS